jgi:hypothetical protein
VNNQYNSTNGQVTTINTHNETKEIESIVPGNSRKAKDNQRRDEKEIKPEFKFARLTSLFWFFCFFFSRSPSLCVLFVSSLFYILPLVFGDLFVCFLVAFLYSSFCVVLLSCSGW